MGKIEGKKELMVDDYMLDKVFRKINLKLGIEKFDDTKILIGRDEKLSEDATWMQFFALIMCFIKEYDKVSP